MGYEISVPEYAKDEVYQELANLCEMAGKKIVYKVLDESVAARTNKCNSIEMPDSEIDNFDRPGIPTLVLGHELGHCLLEMTSPTFLKTIEHLMIVAKDTENVGDFLDRGEELMADLAGELLYSLAQTIGSHNVDQEMRRI